MNRFVSDTMALVLYLENRKLPQNVKQLFQDADIGKIEIIVPAMVLSEISYLSEKGRIELQLEDVETYFTNHHSYQEYPLNMPVIKTAFEIHDIQELHDRLIAGTAKLLTVELITNDPIITKSSHVQTIWKIES